MSKIAIIFGVTGQDGSYLTELLLSKNYEVYGVGRRTSGHSTGRIDHIRNKNFEYIEGDITDFSFVLSLIKNTAPDEIYNLAAQSHVGTSFDIPLHTWDVTGKGVLNILEAIFQTPYARFYQASSSEMFGDQVSENGYQDEDTPMRPQSPYGIAKLAGYHAVRLYRETHNFFACNGILFNHESERRGEKFVTRKITKYVAKLYWDFKTGIDIYSSDYPKLQLGNLEAKRDWGHAEDYVYAMWLMLQQDKPDDYVVGLGETHTVHDFAVRAFRFIGHNADDFIQQNNNLKRPQEVPFLCSNPTKARAVLGWKPKCTFNGLVERMVTADICNAKTS